ncbi:hypothetical protein [Parvularcula sp. IMCC14364]|uniref:hypothetical protein n=1 Tax=Parvularcula sp. IMCC14364 TaxID=3067902 RepID=UPI0027425730|nr:hypothetical protein [Parvularcula sp. IMCC14364]
MITRIRSAIALVCLSVLAACTGIEIAGPGSFQVQKTYQVELGKAWTALPFDARTNLQEMTIDGVLLNVLVFGVDIKDGEALIYSADPKKLVPRFRAGMSDREIVEFLGDSLEYNGLVDVQISNLRPDDFPPYTGVRFNFVTDTQIGLSMNGDGKAVVVDNKLFFLLFVAPAEHYYDLHADEVQSIFDSARFPQSASG